MPTITPRYINEPKPGKKMWSVKDTGGAMYLCYDNIASQLTQNTPADVTVEPAGWNPDMSIIKSVNTGPSQPQQSAAPRPAPANSPAPANLPDVNLREIGIAVNIGITRAIEAGYIKEPDPAQLARWGYATGKAYAMAINRILHPAPQQQGVEEPPQQQESPIPF